MKNLPELPTVFILIFLVLLGISMWAGYVGVVNVEGYGI